jgi:RNA-binding protein
MDTREAAIALARPTHAEVVQVIGHKFVLYRTSQREDIEHIQLV